MFYSNCTNIFSATTPGPSTSSKTSPTTTTNTGSSTTGGSGDTTTGTSSTGTSSPTPGPNGGGKKTPVGAIAGGVVGGIAVIAIAAGLIFWLIVRNRNRGPANGNLGEKNVGTGGAPSNGGAGSANYPPSTNYAPSTAPNYAPAAPHYGPAGGHGGALAGGAAAGLAAGALAAHHHNSQPPEQHDPNYASYYGSDGKPLSGQYAGPGSTSPGAAPAPAYNPHESMYKAPLAAGAVPVPGSPNAPSNNHYEMEGGSGYAPTATSPAISSAHPSTASPVPQHANVAELPTPVQSPGPNHAQVIHEAPSDSLQSPPQSDLSPPPGNASHGYQSGPVPEWQH
jgi:hypothetical protein